MAVGINALASTALSQTSDIGRPLPESPTGKHSCDKHASHNFGRSARNLPVISVALRFLVLTC